MYGSAVCGRGSCGAPGRNDKVKNKNIKNFQKTACNLLTLCYNKATKEKEVQTNEIVIL